MMICVQIEVVWQPLLISLLLTLEDHTRVERKCSPPGLQFRNFSNEVQKGHMLERHLSRSLRRDAI